MDFKKEAELLGIGNTPLIPYEEDFDADIYVKNETMNASGSVKDRAALMMILDAEEKGLLAKGDTIVEATSGNMGISLAYVGIKRGYKVLLTMPETTPTEFREMLQGLGAQVVLTEEALGMKGAIEAAEQYLTKKGHVWLKQFSNPEVVSAHYLLIGEEILNELERIDVVVAGVGTGGTLVGVGRRIREKFPSCEIVAVEPASSPLLSRGASGAHKILGIGANFLPPLYDSTLVNRVELVTDEQALDMFKTLNLRQGYCCGISSAANIVVATRLAEDPAYAGKTIVTFFADSDDRYGSILNAK